MTNSNATESRIFSTPPRMSLSLEETHSPPTALIVKKRRLNYGVGAAGSIRSPPRGLPCRLFLPALDEIDQDSRNASQSFILRPRLDLDLDLDGSPSPSNNQFHGFRRRPSRREDYDYKYDYNYSPVSSLILPPCPVPMLEDMDSDMEKGNTETDEVNTNSKRPSLKPTTTIRPKRKILSACCA